MSVPPDPPSPPPFPGSGSSPPPRNDSAGKAGRGEPALRRTVVRPARPVVDPVDGAFVADRLTTLTHELANLLDGSMRCLTLARRSVGVACPPGEPPAVAELSRHLDTVHAAMRQMSDLVKCAMQGVPLANLVGAADGAGLADAVRYAVDVMTPLADERRVRLELEIAPELVELPAGPVFAIVANALRNALESIERAGRGCGCVEVSARAEAGKTGRCVVIDIADDGEGPPELPARDGESVFRLGYSTKPGGCGIGLAVNRELVQELGGTIELVARGASPGGGGAGAVLRVMFPVPRGRDV